MVLSFSVVPPITNDNFVLLVLASKSINGRFVSIPMVDFHVPASVRHDPRLCIDERRRLVSEEGSNELTVEC